MSVRAFQVHLNDNVATMLDDSGGGQVAVLGPEPTSLEVREAVKMGHKVALANIAVGQPVVKFGVPIGMATREIEAGRWVHLHNLASSFDERSSSLDVHTGAATDTKYE